MQLETEARLFVHITNMAPSQVSASDEIAVSVPRPEYFLLARIHPTRTRRKEA